MEENNSNKPIQNNKSPNEAIMLIEKYYQRGVEEYKAGQYHKSLIDMQQLIKQANKITLKAYIIRGICYKEMQYMEGALNQFMMALQRDKFCLQIYGNIVQVMHALSGNMFLKNILKREKEKSDYEVKYKIHNPNIFNLYQYEQRLKTLEVCKSMIQSQYKKKINKLFIGIQVLLHKQKYLQQALLYSQFCEKYLEPQQNGFYLRYQHLLMDIAGSLVMEKDRYNYYRRCLQIYKKVKQKGLDNTSFQLNTNFCKERIDEIKRLKGQNSTGQNSLINNSQFIPVSLQKFYNQQRRQQIDHNFDSYTSGEQMNMQTYQQQSFAVQEEQLLEGIKKGDFDHILKNAAVIRYSQKLIQQMIKTNEQKLKDIINFHKNQISKGFKSTASNSYIHLEAAIQFFKIMSCFQTYAASAFNQLGLAYILNGKRQLAEWSFLNSIMFQHSMDPYVNLGILLRQFKQDKLLRQLKQDKSQMVEEILRIIADKMKNEEHFLAYAMFYKFYDKESEYLSYLQKQKQKRLNSQQKQVKQLDNLVNRIIIQDQIKVYQSITQRYILHPRILQWKVQLMELLFENKNKITQKLYELYQYQEIVKKFKKHQISRKQIEISFSEISYQIDELVCVQFNNQFNVQIKKQTQKMICEIMKTNQQPLNYQQSIIKSHVQLCQSKPCQSSLQKSLTHTIQYHVNQDNKQIEMKLYKRSYKHSKGYKPKIKSMIQYKVQQHRQLEILCLQMHSLLYKYLSDGKQFHQKYIVRHYYQDKHIKKRQKYKKVKYIDIKVCMEQGQPVSGKIDTIQQFQRFVIQLFQIIHCLDKQKIFHGDLKRQNLVYQKQKQQQQQELNTGFPSSKRTRIKAIDFDLAYVYNKVESEQKNANGIAAYHKMRDILKYILNMKIQQGGQYQRELFLQFIRLLIFGAKQQFCERQKKQEYILDIHTQYHTKKIRLNECVDLLIQLMSQTAPKVHIQSVKNIIMNQINFSFNMTRQNAIQAMRDIQKEAKQSLSKQHSYEKLKKQLMKVGNN